MDQRAEADVGRRDDRGLGLIDGRIVEQNLLVVYTTTEVERQR